MSTRLVLIAVRKETETVYGGLIAHRGLDRRDAENLFELYAVEATCTRVAIVQIDDEHAEVMRDMAFPSRMATPLDETAARQLDNISGDWFHRTFWPECKETPCVHKARVPDITWSSQ